MKYEAWKSLQFWSDFIFGDAKVEFQPLSKCLNLQSVKTTGALLPSMTLIKDATLEYLRVWRQVLSRENLWESKPLSSLLIHQGKNGQFREMETLARSAKYRILEWSNPPFDKPKKRRWPTRIKSQNRRLASHSGIIEVRSDGSIQKIKLFLGLKSLLAGSEKFTSWPECCMEIKAEWWFIDRTH